jgi:hypothetical protein
MQHSGREARQEVFAMPYRIQVPLNSPALDSYLNDGWRQARTEGQWAVLQMDELEVSHYPDVPETPPEPASMADH